MSIILEIDIKDITDFGHESFGAGLIVVAFHIVAPVDFVDFASGGTGTGDFKIAWEGKHGDIASFLIKADYHNRIGKLGAVMDIITLGAFHIIATCAKSENISTTILVGFEWFVGFREEVENIAISGHIIKFAFEPDDENNTSDEKN